MENAGQSAQKKDSTATLPSVEKLKSRKRITQLFQEGKSVSNYPIKLVYLPMTPAVTETVVVAFTVPKRKFKLAVSRNRIKRLLRESYRTQKSTLFNNIETPYAFLILYIGKEIPTQPQIDRAMEGLLKSFLKKVT